MSLATTDRYCAEHAGEVSKAATMIADHFRCMGELLLLLCDIGGLSIDAQHVAGEFVNRFLDPHIAAANQAQIQSMKTRQAARARP